MPLDLSDLLLSGLILFSLTSALGIFSGIAVVRSIRRGLVR